MADIYELTTRSALNLRFALRHAGSSARELRGTPLRRRLHGSTLGRRGVAPRSRASALVPSEQPKSDPRLTPCAPGCCGRFLPLPLCSPSRRRPWSRLRRRLGRTCRWRLSAPRPPHLLAASSSTLTPLCLHLQAAAWRGAGDWRQGLGPDGHLRHVPVWQHPVRVDAHGGGASSSCPVSHGAAALTLCVCARPLTDQARAGVHGGVGWLPRPGVRAPLQRLPVQDA